MFIKKGSIIPLWENVQYVPDSLIEKITVKIYPDTQGEYVLYEDDGITFNYEDGVYSKTKIAYTCSGNHITVFIDNPVGSYDLPSNREYNVELYVDEPANLPYNATYNTQKNAVCFTLKSGEKITI